MKGGKKDQNIHKDCENPKQEGIAREEVSEEVTPSADNIYGKEDNSSNEEKDNEAELKNIMEQLEAKTKKCEEYFDMLQRTIAEFDNYKKRTIREKEALYSESVSDVIATFLPVVDNIERACQIPDTNGDNKSIKEGITLVLRQIKDILSKHGVEEIKSVGETFNPELHNAVMHVTDESAGENMVVEEFQKGYMLKDRVIRHSMVKVAN